MGCKVCQGPKYAVKGKGTGCRSWMSADRDVLHVEVQGMPEWGSAFYVVRFSARFCPMCGRELGKEAE